MTQEQAELERRILAGKVNIYDATQYAREHGLPCESWDEIQRATEEIYANVVPKRTGIPGTMH